MRICVYVDAFNLYYGAVKETPYKWLDIEELCNHLLQPSDDVVLIKYFTALISPQSDDLKRPDRQRVYLRALCTLPKIKIVFGSFRTHKTFMPKVPEGNEPVKFVKVFKTEEKGSDVNLGVHLVNDAHRGLFESAVVISNDSDLLEPIRIVSQELKKKVGVINPSKNRSSVLRKYSDFTKRIRSGVLQKSQFPKELMDRKGKFHKPDTW